MIGWINLSVEAFICDSFGRDAWLAIIKQAHVDCNWVSSCPYPDKITYDLVITGAGILGVTVPQALEAYGQYFVNYVIKQGYLRLMRSLGSNIAEFLANLNNLHLHLSMGFPSMVAPAFRVEQVTSSSLLLHYHSIRPALWPIVSGVLKGASKELFAHEVEIELVASRDAGDCDHEIFRVSYPYQASLARWDDHHEALASEYGMCKDFFFEMFPFHLLLDAECRVVQVGSVMARLFGDTLTRGSPVSDTFKLRHPYIPFEYERMLLECDSLFLLKALLTGLEFKGQMVKTSMPDGRPALLFLGSPRVANLEEMSAHGLYLSDIPLHDMSRDFVLLAEQRQAEADLKERFEKMAVELRLANERLEQTTRWLDEERQRSDALLYRMLPADIAADLREGRKVEAINYPEVTILFSDMVGFTTTSAKSTAEEVYNMLNEMYDRFDSLVDEFPDIYKLETIGDAYFLVCNLTTQCDDHVDVVIDFAIRMQALARLVKNAQGEPVQIRIGIHTGPVVGGVLGAKTPRFSIYGDTVNVASRMESHGLPGKIHISGAAYNRIVDKAKYAVRERGNIAVKGRGNMTTYLIGGTHDDWLLRHTSFDAQLDGVYRDSGGGAAATVGREGSFVITSSGKSLENLNNSNRMVQAMEAIKEGDEDRATRAVGSSGGGARHAPPGRSGTSGLVTGSSNMLRSGSFTSGANSSGLGPPLVTAMASLGSDVPDSATASANPAALANGAAPAAAPAAIAALSRSGTGEMPLLVPQSANTPGSGGNGVPPAPLSAVVGSSAAAAAHKPVRHSSSFREGAVTGLRESSYRDSPSLLSGAPPPGMGRETSFRAVYARGGARSQGPNSPLMAAGSGSNRAYIAAVASNMRDGGSAASLGGTGGSGGGLTHGLGGSGLLGGGDGEQVPSAPVSMIDDGSVRGAGTGSGMMPLLAEATPYMRPEPSGGSGLAGVGGTAGVVMARSAAAKASPLAQQSTAQAAPSSSASLAASGATAPGTAVAAATPREASRTVLAPVTVAVGPTAAPLHHQHNLHASMPTIVTRVDSSMLPPPQRSADSLRGSIGRGLRESDAGLSGEGSSTPSGKSKSLASKLKNLFKK